MCGIAGFLGAGGSNEERERELAAMTGAVRHRGPDDSGLWFDAECGFGLGHRRLAILDLSPNGHQPMTSPGGRFVLSHNGEIYNFGAVRKELESSGTGIVFRSRSDTEVILAAVETWGLEGALERFIGMFAFALWDRRERQLHLVRDRIGVKPLYYGWAGNTFLFGSELGALAAHSGFEPRIDPRAVSLFLRHGYVPAPHAIYRRTHKLEPGRILTVSADDPTAIGVRSYWSAAETVARARENPLAGSLEGAAESLEELLLDAVRLRLISDVPLGVFLSGGIDSATVTALMQKAGGGPVRTFTIGSANPAYDESSEARRIAAFLGTTHAELILSDREIMDAVPRMPALTGEPFADSSQIPTWLVSRLARESVTVVLSGDGGDELFAGYNRYVWGPRLWKRIERIPESSRRVLARWLGSLSPAAADRLYAGMKFIIPAGDRVRLPGDKLRKLTAGLDSSSVDAFTQGLLFHWKRPSELIVEREVADSIIGGPDLDLPVERMMFRDLVGYLPDDVLTKVDRASMAFGLEVRVPFLDHRVVELAWRLPLGLKLQGGEGKRVVRRVLGKHLPAELVSGPKMGFAVPVGEWLRGPLRDWAEAALDRGRLEREGILDPERVRTAWETHLAGRGDGDEQIWDLVVFQAWLEGCASGTRPRSAQSSS